MKKLLQATIPLLLLLVTCEPVCAQALEDILSKADPFSTIPTKELTTLVKQLEPLEKNASPQQQLTIDLLKMRYLAITGDLSPALELVGKFDSPSVPPEFRIRAYTIAIPIYHMQGNYILSFHTLNKIQQLLPWTENKNLKYLAISLAPELYTDAGNLDTALEYAIKSIAAAKETNDPINMCTAYDAYSGIQFKRGDVEAAVIGFNKMLNHCDEQSATLFSGTAYGGLALVFQAQERHQEAIAHYATALDLHREANYHFGIAFSLLGLAQSHFALGNTQIAQTYLEDALSVLESDGVMELLVDAYDLQGQMAERKGHFKEALTSFNEKWATEKKVMDNRKAIRIAQLQVAFEVKNKERRIALLQKENGLLALQKQSTLLHSWLMILGLTVLVLAAALLWRKARQESRHFKHLSRIDPLTGLYNHAYCYSLAEKMFHECHRNNRPFVAIVADIDWFKRVNDTYGHAAGDKVLQAIAKVLQQHMGSKGIAGRTGGEEFSCFLANMDIEEALRIVRNCRDAIQPVMDYGKEIEVTLSYGIAVSHGEHNMLDLLVREADEALYEAKNKGRNQIIYHASTAFRKKA
ncbi:MAG TPA: diguanylate cyclase [Chromatiaceae bacterium]|nr:diguanylate cyclase [Chromatiaceae bacterium]